MAPVPGDRLQFLEILANAMTVALPSEARDGKSVSFYSEKCNRHIYVNLYILDRL